MHQSRALAPRNLLSAFIEPHVACRQKRELDQLVEYEVKRAQIQGKAEAKLAKQEERAEAQRRAREEKEKAWRIALREQELKRLAAEREEEAANKRADQVIGRVLCVLVNACTHRPWAAMPDVALVHPPLRMATAFRARLLKSLDRQAALWSLPLVEGSQTQQVNPFSDTSVKFLR